jgi:hypothetical protein
MRGKAFRGRVDPEIRVAPLLLIRNAMIHQNRDPATPRLPLPCQRSEQVKCNQSI